MKNINCQFNNGTSCKCKQIPRSLFGIGPRVCSEMIVGLPECKHINPFPDPRVTPIITKYRAINKGGNADYLQYFSARGTWEYVPIAYWHEIFKDLYKPGESYATVRGNDNELKRFIKKWPVVQDYLDKVYNPEMRRLQKIERDYDAEWRSRKGETRDLT